MSFAVARMTKLKADNLQKDKEIAIFKDLLSEYKIDSSNKIVENTNNDKEFINLNEHNLKAWLFGHWHINYIKKPKFIYLQPKKYQKMGMH